MNYAEFFNLWQRSKPYYGPGRPCPYCGRLDCICGKKSRQEVRLSDDLEASFHREAQSVSLISENCVLFLDREETYRLVSLLTAEFKEYNHVS